VNNAHSPTAKLIKTLAVQKMESAK